MNAIAFLLTEHQRLRGQIDRLQSRETDVPKEDFVALATDLVIHAGLEEEILYPRLLQIAALRDGARHAYHEHHLLDTQIDELSAIDPQEGAWKDKLHVLQETLVHHLDEEEKDVFPQVRKKFSAAELELMGEAMGELRAEFTRRYRDQPPESAQRSAAERITGDMSA